MDRNRIRHVFGWRCAATRGCGTGRPRAPCCSVVGGRLPTTGDFACAAGVCVAFAPATAAAAAATLGVRVRDTVTTAEAAAAAELHGGLLGLFVAIFATAGYGRGGSAAADSDDSTANSGGDRVSVRRECV